MLGDIGTPGAHLIVGPAGSGKTTLLRERFAALVRAKEPETLLLVHSRRAARTLRERIIQDVGRSTDQVRVTTWHAFCLSLLRAHYRTLGHRREPALLTGPEQFTLVRDMLADPAEKDRWGEFRPHTYLRGFIEELREFVLRAQDALREPADLEAKAREAKREDLEEASRFFARYLKRLDDPSDAVVDHANVIARAWHLMRAEGVGDEIRAEARHILVDDFQDCTPAQQALLRELAIGASSVVVAADPAGKIFGFRGAADDPIEAYKRDFAPVKVLERTERTRPAPAADAWLFDHLTEEADAIARECIRLRAREGIGFGQISVIVRRFGPVSRAIRRAFERARVPHVVVGENRPLQAEPSLRPMLDLARFALREDKTDELLSSVLSSPAVGLEPYTVRALRREARLRRTSLDTLVVEPSDALPEKDREKLRALERLVDALSSEEMRAKRPDEVFWFLWEGLPFFREFVASADDDALDAIAAFARAVERFSDRRPGKTFADYIGVLEGVEFGPEPWNMPEDRRPDAVRIMTAHSAAGTECEAVIVAGCVEGEFPNTRTPRAMLDLRDLLNPASPFERSMERLDEERRLFGVAVSRARTRVLLTAARESSQREALTPSPFVHLAGLEWLRPEPAEPGSDALTRDEAEAAARRALRNGAADERALDMLARLPGVDPDTWWYEREWTDPGIPIAPEELRTSYSRLSNYDNCALQYLYQVELGLDPQTSHQMLVGTWVHDIVDKCARGEIAASEEALIAALDEVWDPKVFEATAVEHRRRLDSEEMLRRWLRTDGQQAVLATEVGFEFPIDGAIMRGRIDRVVRFGSNKTRVTDYKTGRSSKSDDEIKEDLQLASYYLALKRDPSLANLGEPKYVELAYLGAFWQDGFVRRGFDPTAVENFEQLAQQRLEDFVAGIRAERFAPSPSADCQWCRFKTLCPVWPEGDEVDL
ncbi:MAG: ATP-dependent helicase [Actinomycetota bacterium]